MKNTTRIDKILSNLGFGSRKEVKDLIKSGLVELDNEIIYDSGLRVDTDIQDILVNGKKINYKRFVYLMLNKPQGVISATEDRREKTVIDLLPKELQSMSLSPVGRLDKDTEGLLILTNDGQLAHKLLSPKKHVPKTYFAIIEGRVNENDVEAFNKGVELGDGYITLPAGLEVLVQGRTSEIKVTIYEGKYHQVKRMFEAVDKKVTYLKRISMGALELDENLELGHYKELSEYELDILNSEG